MRLPSPGLRIDAGAAWPPVLATVGPGAASSGHAHHAMHLVLARTGALRVSHAGRTRRLAGVLTAPDVAHAIDATGREIVLVFADPESDSGARLCAGMAGPLRAIDADERDRLLADLPPASEVGALFAWATTTLAGLAGGDGGPRRVHPRVRRVLAHLRSADADADTSLAALARLAGLSESRLLHVFREAIGLPLRPYVLWLRLQRACAAIAGGAPLADAAAQAGFADAAHMTRTFRRMFGMTPATLRSGLTSQPVRSRPAGARAARSRA
jgi:AraC-like DNA-binding protein